MIDMVEYRGGWLKIYSDDPNAYGLRVRGDSMWPRIQSGEFVLIEPGTSVHSGDEVFVRTADGHNMIKVLNYTREGGYQFTSINQDHRPITLPQSAVLKVEYRPASSRLRAMLRMRKSITKWFSHHSVVNQHYGFADEVHAAKSRFRDEFI